MHIAKHAIRRPVTTMMGVMIVVILGIISLTRIPIDLYPAIDLKTAAVITSYSGVGPEEVESLVTKPIESAVATVAGLKSIRSTSREGTSMVIVEFDYSVNMDSAVNEMQQKVERAKRKLPDGADAPSVVKFDPNSTPILTLSVSGDLDAKQLKSLVDQDVQPYLERVDGVASVDVSGGLDREVQILVNPERLDQYGLSLSDLSTQLKNQNLNSPGGTVTEGGAKYVVRSLGKFETVDDIRKVSIQLKGNGGGSIKLSDVATIIDGYKEVQVENKYNGKPTISISIMKQTGTNTVAVSDGVYAAIKNLKGNLPGNVQIVPISDQSKFIRASINTLVHDTLIGGFLAMVIIMLFLRSLKNTMIISTAIPIAIIATFVLMYFSNMSINIMSLGGLTLGVGMIVDDAIVVLENIFRHREKGATSLEAAASGTKEVTMPVIASTLTTVAVFLPIVFVEGIAAQLFRDMAVTVSFSLLVSLVVSLTLTPMLSSRWVSLKKNHVPKTVEQELADEAKWILFYRKMLNWALGHRKSVVFIGIVALAAGLGLIPFVGSEFIPSSDQGEINVNIQLPPGTKIEETRDVIQQSHKIIEKIPEVKEIFSSVGSGNATRSFGGGSTDTGAFTIRLVDLSQRKRSSATIVEELRGKLNQFPGSQIRISEAAANMLPGLGGGGGGGGPIAYALRGDDDKELAKLADEITRDMGQIEGIRQAQNSLDATKPEIQIKLDRDKAADLGITQSTIATTVNTAVAGSAATTYEVDGTEVDVTVKYKDDRVAHMQDIQNLLLTTSKGEKVKLKEVAQVGLGTGPKTIQRYNQARVVNLSAAVAPGVDLGTVSGKVDQLLDKYPLPPGFIIEKQGQNKQMQDSFMGLAFAFLLALVLVYMILAAQFESMVYPLSIMLSVPLSIFGAMFGLWVTGRPLSVPAYIGMILLAGIVVRNAIVLIDFTNVLREQGMSRLQALLVAGPIRLRPIIMTTLTTSLGLLPLAAGLGEGGESQAPMATVVVGGLIFSTLLTLIVIPVVYTVLEDLFIWIKKRMQFGKKKPEQEQVLHS